mmetsp:Transcript_20010/g.56708  ORF Transcript_20010/g.56708 Transcript_20010/m.56708 type:complete len:497 (-) Transcript_20010:364-1854(-)
MDDDASSCMPSIFRVAADDDTDEDIGAFDDSRVVVGTGAVFDAFGFFLLVIIAGFLIIFFLKCAKICSIFSTEDAELDELQELLLLLLHFEALVGVGVGWWAVVGLVPAADVDVHVQPHAHVGVVQLGMLLVGGTWEHGGEEEVDGRHLPPVVLWGAAVHGVAVVAVKAGHAGHIVHAAEVVVVVAVVVVAAADIPAVHWSKERVRIVAIHRVGVVHAHVHVGGLVEDAIEVADVVVVDGSAIAVAIGLVAVAAAAIEEATKVGKRDFIDDVEVVADGGWVEHAAGHAHGVAGCRVVIAAVRTDSVVGVAAVGAAAKGEVVLEDVLGSLEDAIEVVEGEGLRCRRGAAVAECGGQRRRQRSGSDFRGTGGAKSGVSAQRAAVVVAVAVRVVHRWLLHALLLLLLRNHHHHDAHVVAGGSVAAVVVERLGGGEIFEVLVRTWSNAGIEPVVVVVVVVGGAHRGDGSSSIEVCHLAEHGVVSITAAVVVVVVGRQRRR